MIGVVGEALIDFIAKATVGASVPFDSHIGGCALNTAVAATRLGSCVEYIGKISADAFGQRILDYLVDNQVMFDPSLCAASEPSLLAFATLDAEGKAQYIFSTKGTAPVSLTKEELLAALQEPSDLRVLHIGSISLALPPACDVIPSAIQAFQPKPIIFLDPNVRPAVIQDSVAYKRRLETVLELASFVKLSDEDLSLLYPGMDVMDKARELARQYQLQVILTLGKQGSRWYTPQGLMVSMPIIDLPVIDTVGAGDTFSGALLSYLHDRDCFGSDGELPELVSLDQPMIQDALRFATAASAITCSRRGCDPPTKDEVLQLLSSL